MKYLIIGGTGSLGKKLIYRLLPTSQVSVYSRDESKHWTIRNELQGNQELSQKEKNNFSSFVGDIRDKNRIRDVIRQVKPNRIIIAAALKHVDTCECSPNESIATNLIGTQNVIDVVNDMNTDYISSVLFVSTDKSCSPVNTYGMCKALSERVVTSQVLTGLQHYAMKYLVVRYGNVLESRGSIIPLFKYQAENTDYLTVTDPNMTRFVMTLDDSVDLIMNAFNNGASGDTWIPRLPAMKIGDLAEIFCEIYNKKIKIIGHRPGEKMHEDLINESESVRTFMTLNNHYVIKPSLYVPKPEDNVKIFTYTSADDVMTKEQLRAHLCKLNIINKPLNEFKGTTIEEIATNRYDNRS